MGEDFFTFGHVEYPDSGFGGLDEDGEFFAIG